MSHRPVVRLCLATVVSAAVLTGIIESAASVSARQADGFVALFDGRSLAGWRALPARGALPADEPKLAPSWRLDESVLVSDGKGAFAASERALGDAEIQLEFRSDGGRPGVVVRSTSSDPVGASVLTRGRWPGGEPPARGNWHTLRIVQAGERASIWIDGTLAADHLRLTSATGRAVAREGSLVLQAFDGPVRWRNVRAKSLSSAEATTFLRQPEAGEFTSLFDGRSLAGWKGAVDHYEVVDGAIRCRKGSGGTLFTEREFTDFTVRLEFRLPHGGNNGLAIRYPGEGDTAYVGMCELQVLDDTDPKYATLDPRQYTGSIYGMVAAQRGYLRPVGEWNFEQVTVRGSRITVELNGTVITDGDVSTVSSFMDDREHPGKDRTRGHFGFAGHNDPVEYRNVRIREDRR
jgi:hypothetical protein